jgi:paraquat-inducible protein A
MRLGGRRFLLSFAIIGAAVCLALGISLPIIRLTKYVFWSTEHSLLSTVEVLIRDGQVFLGFTVLIFSIVLPVLKLLYLLLISTLPAAELVRQHRRLARTRVARQMVHARRARALANDLLHQGPRAL